MDEKEREEGKRRREGEKVMKMKKGRKEGSTDSQEG